MTVLQLGRERDGAARRPLEDAFDPDDRPVLETLSASLEGKTTRQKNPHPKGSLAFAAWVLARLGVGREEEWPFALADGREVRYPVAAARVRLPGRTRHTLAVFGDASSEPLLGAYTLEAFGLAADPANRRLVPVPGLLKAAS